MKIKTGFSNTRIERATLILLNINTLNYRAYRFFRKTVQIFRVGFRLPSVLSHSIKQAHI